MTTISFLQLFAPTQVNNASPTILYTVPSSPSSSLLRNARVRFSNTTGSAATIKAWAVPSAGAATDSTVMLPTHSVAANDYIDIDVPVMSAGGSLQAQAGTGTAITATCLDGFLQS